MNTVPPLNLVRHREREAGRLESMVTDTAATAVLVTGPPGAGKTMAVKQTLRTHLSTEIQTAYVNCWRLSSRNDVLYGVVTEFFPQTHRNATPRATVLNRLTTPVDGPRVVVLDEADRLVDPEVLYDLADAPNLLMVLVSSTEDGWFESVDPRIRSRLQTGAHIQFGPYETDQLVDILRERANVALPEDAIADRQLVQISKRAEGDARMAINALRCAAINASDAGHVEIQDEDIAAALSGGEILEAGLSTDFLPHHQGVLVEIVEKEREIAPGELYNQYQEAVEEPRSKRQVRSYLNELSEMGCLSQSGEGPAKRWEAAEEKQILP